MNWSTLRPDTKKLVGLIALFVLLSGAQPILWQVVQWQALIVQDKRSVSHQTANVTKRTTELRGTLESQQHVLAQLGTIAPQVDDLTTIVERLEHLASTHDLRIQLRHISDETAVGAGEADSGILNAVIVSATVAGDINDVLTYLEALEHMPELLVITFWEVQPASGGVPVVSPPIALPESSEPVSSVTNYEMAFDVMFFLQRDLNTTLQTIR